MAHIHEKIDFTAEVFIVYQNKVLLRKHDKYKIWLSVGGHIELDEDPNQAAIREVKEEVGIDVKLYGQVMSFNEPEGYRELIPPVFLNRHKINDGHEHIALVYFASSETDQITQMAFPSEVSCDIHWFSLEELSGPKFQIQDSIIHYAKVALATLHN